MDELRYRRVMLKLSGEALAGEQGFGIEPKTIQSICRELAEAVSLGVQLPAASITSLEEVTT